MNSQYRSSPESPGTSRVTGNRKLYRRARKVHHKVRTGCTACKTRRQKCDEQKPICSGCVRYSSTCAYMHSDHFHTTPGLTESSSSLSRSLTALPSPELNFSDLELLHQYLTSTCIATSQLPEVNAHLQANVPPLAQNYPFVMHGILAMAAVHLSRLRPSHQPHYDLLATSNHSKALPEFQLCLRNMNTENCYALILYSKSLVWCSMASDQSSTGTKNAGRGNSGWLPQWFILLRGSCCVVKSAQQWLATNPLPVQMVESYPDNMEALEDQHISVLQSQLSSRNAPVTLDNILLKLREAFARASMHRQSTPYRNAINVWVGSLSDEYIVSLQQKEAWALVILAHFCVLLHRSETVWFMKGHALRLLLLIDEILDEDWKELIKWPFNELGISDHGPS